MNFFNPVETDRSLTFTNRLFKKHLENRFRSPLTWPLCDEDPDDWKRVQFKSESGSTLTALYASARRTPKGTVVCAHPLAKSAKCYFLENGYSTCLRSYGYNVLLFDFNGFGESSSGNFNFTADLMAAARAAGVLSDSDWLGFWGIGFGASWGVSALKFNHLFKVGIFDSPFPNFRKYLNNHPYLDVKTRLLSRLLPPKSPVVDFLHARNIEQLLFLFDRDNDAVSTGSRKQFTEICQTNWPPDSDRLAWLEWPRATYDIRAISNKTSTNGKADYLDQVLGWLDQYFEVPDKKPVREALPGINGQAHRAYPARTN